MFTKLGKIEVIKQFTYLLPFKMFLYKHDPVFATGKPIDQWKQDGKANAGKAQTTCTSCDSENICQKQEVLWLCTDSKV